VRYRRAIRGYLGAILRNSQDADEVAQDLLVKLLQGSFAGADVSRGRFRDYLKSAVRNAAVSFLRRQHRQAALDLHELQPADEDHREALWREECRRPLLDAALARLSEFEAKTPGNLGATLCRLLVEHPHEDASELASRVEQQLGRRLKPEAIRKQISRARRKLAEFLRDEVRATLTDTAPQFVDEELRELGLHEYIAGYDITENTPDQ